MIREGANAEPEELVPETETSFFTRDNRRLTYTFIKEANGEVTNLVVQQEGREIGRAKKIK